MFKKILVASDFSVDADGALTQAINLARQSGGHLDIVHASLPDSFVLPPPLDLVALPPRASTFEHVAQQVEARVQRARDKGISATGHTLTGPAPQAVIDHARSAHADLIVVGTRGLGALAHTLLGSVAEKIVRHAPCPVLVVPRHER